MITSLGNGFIGIDCDFCKKEWSSCCGSQDRAKVEFREEGGVITKGLHFCNKECRENFKYLTSTK